MPELELVEERLISGKGVLRVPSAARKARYWIMYADVIRLPTNEYRELNWNPYQSLYARMVYRRDGYVQTYDYLRYTREQRTYINDITGQNLRAIKCAYEGILQTFFNLGNALALPSISITNLIKDYKSLALSWDEILFSCYSNTALQIRFFKLDYDVCNEENDDSDDPPPPPPPLPPVPPGTPIGSISPPYDEGDNDDGNTDPFDGDEIEPPFPPLPDNTLLKWNASTRRNPRTTYAQAVFNTFTPVSQYFVLSGNEDAGNNAKEWLTRFTSGATQVNGSAVGDLSPEDKPVLYLWQDGITDEPWQIITPG